MSLRWCVVLCLGLASAGVAQQKTPDIVVNGVNPKDRKAVSWKRAEADHVIVFSKGDDGELIRVTKTLERLYHLMSRIYRRGDQRDTTVKLQVTLVGSRADYRALDLANLRSVEGPYVTAFTEQAYYDPRDDGAVMAVARSSQIVDLNTNRAYDLDCSDQFGEGALECKEIYHVPAVQTWEQRLYAAYARHFLQTYAPMAYPRWYMDGVGMVFSTLKVRGNGALDYGEPPERYREVFRGYGNLDVAKVLTGHYLDAAPGKLGWTPYHAWLLTHYFAFSPLKPERARQFQAYMTAIGQGAAPADAAKAFGDLRALQRDLSAYLDRDKSFARTAPAQPAGDDPTIAILAPGAAATVTARVELGSRLADGDTAAKLRRDGWIAQLRETVSKLPYDAEAQLLLAEAECRGGHPAECLAAAGRVLATSPDNVRALAWRGVALTDYAVAGAPADRAARLTLARAALDRAISLDDDAPLPRIALFESYTKAGEPVPDAAMAGMASAIRDVPAAPAPRLLLAAELVRQGKGDLAKRVVQILLYGAYDSPERQSATALFAAVGN